MTDREPVAINHDPSLPEGARRYDLSAELRQNGVDEDMVTLITDGMDTNPAESIATIAERIGITPEDLAAFREEGVDRMRRAQWISQQFAAVYSLYEDFYPSFDEVIPNGAYTVEASIVGLRLGDYLSFLDGQQPMYPSVIKFTPSAE